MHTSVILATTSQRLVVRGQRSQLGGVLDPSDGDGEGAWIGQPYLSQMKLTEPTLVVKLDPDEVCARRNSKTVPTVVLHAPACSERGIER